MNTVGIFGPPCPTRAEVLRVESHLIGLLLHGSWEIVIGDGYGIEADVLRTVSSLGRKITVVGTGRRPANGASSRVYERVVALGTRSEKQWQRDQFIIGMSDMVVCVQQPEIEARIPFHKRADFMAYSTLAQPVGTFDRGFEEIMKRGFGSQLLPMLRSKN